MAFEFATAGELAGFVLLFTTPLTFEFECVSVFVLVVVVVVVVVVLVFVTLEFIAGLLAVLLAACSPQAMPRAPSARTDESTITFFIFGF
ncbi:MAG: hypothetical protein C4324_10605 [Blastocatellia bacterium]